MIKKFAFLSVLLTAFVCVGQSAHATSATLSVFTSTAPASPGGTTLAAPAANTYTELLGCVFSNGYSAGACVTISSSVSGEPSIELCAASSTTVHTGAGQVGAAGAARNVPSLNAILGQRLLYSGALTVTGTQTQSNILLMCGWRTTNTLGN